MSYVVIGSLGFELRDDVILYKMRKQGTAAETYVIRIPKLNDDELEAAKNEIEKNWPARVILRYDRVIMDIDYTYFVSASCGELTIMTPRLPRVSRKRNPVLRRYEILHKQ